MHLTKKILITLTLIVPCAVWAHQGIDSVDKIEKYDSKIERYQSALSSSVSTQETFETINKQVSILQQKIFLLRNMMASEYPHVKKNMSKYEIDYIRAIDKSLKQIKTLLKHVKQTTLQ
ncbi:MAG: hypothetical protein HRT93_08510 [Piscirickettsiaceae bacterium]|nr:hypothetical protein [Piscirickettsiaceae bacterium]